MRFNTWEDKLTPLYRFLIGVLIVIIGIVKQLFSDKPLEMYAFYIMVFGVLCIANAIMMKITKEKVNIIFYVICTMILLIVGINLREFEGLKGVMLNTIYVVLFVVEWIKNAIVIKIDDGIKRAVMGFVAAFINVLFMAITFLIPILIAVFK